MEDWLYDEGFDCEKAVYEAKLKELKDAFAPSQARAYEAEQRPEQFNTLSGAIDKYTKFAASTEEEYAHIAPEDKQKVAAEAASALAWMTETKAALDALAKTADPTVKAAEIAAKATALSAVCEPITRTPKPVPMQTDPPPAEPAAESAEPAAEAANADAADAPKTDEASKPDNMDVD